MAIVVVIAGTYLGYQQFAASGCSGSVRLNVAAAPEIVPAIKSVADQWTKAGAEIDGTCIAVDVTDELPATIASAVTRDHSVALIGLNPAPDAKQVPDVWVPDSSTWLLRIQTEAAGFLPRTATSVAQSPLVLAMPEPIAKNFGWPNKSIGWGDLLTNFSTDEPLQVGIMDPTQDASGLTSLLALSQASGAVGGDPIEALKAKSRALTALDTNKAVLREELVAKFPKSEADIGSSNTVSAAPLSEEDVVAYNAERPAIPLSAIYMEPSPAPLDYPYTIMPQVVDEQKKNAAEDLLEQLQSAVAKNALAAAGLRAPDGSYGANFPAPMGAPKASPAVTPAATKSAEGTAASAALTGADLSAVVGGWIATTKPGQALTVFDTSGSMGEAVPTAGGKTRAQVTQAAASVGLSLFSNKWSVGVWRFSTNENGSRPWKQLVGITSLTTGREKLQNSIAQLDPNKDGGTGLYDTVLDAYNHVKKNYSPQKINSVILFTDGANENSAGLDKDQVVAALKKAQDPKRPIRLVLIGIGDKVSVDELKMLRDALPNSNSGVFLAPDPTKITSIFAQAIGSRTGVI
ncbi:substrate-binding domain-containing protein [Actinoplanes sichuanensis]|nr:substrate-binding domain-containing protein [Actinoplanes sichuanensis]